MWEDINNCVISGVVNTTPLINETKNKILTALFVLKINKFTTVEGVGTPYYSFIQVYAFGKIASTIQKNVEEGDKVAIVGEIQTRESSVIIYAYDFKMLKKKVDTNHKLI